MDILYLGPEGSHSNIAANIMFPKGNLLGLDSLDDIFFALDTHQDAIAVVSVENSIGGDIHETFDRLLGGEYRIYSELYLKINHNLLIHPDTDLSKIKKIYVQPQTRLQCSNFLKTLPHLEQIIVSSTSAGAKMISEHEDLETAAIASFTAAKKYGLKIAQESINNDKNNFTRYVCLMRELFEFPPGESNKCSMIFEIPNAPGALVKALKALADKEYNVTKVESRSIAKKPWTYSIYIDFTFSELLDLSDFEDVVQNIQIIGIYEQGSKMKE
jgi:chorismate mutase/prephenate dehydratase